LRTFKTNGWIEIDTVLAGMKGGFTLGALT